MGYDKNMIYSLNGLISAKTDKYAIVEVNDIGYKVFCPVAVLSKLELAVEMKLFCHFHVREDAMELFGFLRKDELDFFELLITISGIGPRVALGIMSIAPVEQIKEAVASGREEFLTRVSGVGGKIAKKVILELKDKLPQLGEGMSVKMGEELEAIDALVGLGYREAEAREMIKKLPKDLKGVEDIVRAALKYLGKNKSR